MANILVDASGQRNSGLPRDFLQEIDDSLNRVIYVRLIKSGNLAGRSRRPSPLIIYNGTCNRLKCRGPPVTGTSVNSKRSECVRRWVCCCQVLTTSD
jgi:hypothetical protein